MNQLERRLYLTRSLLEENPTYRSIDVPEDPDAQKRLLRSLFNVRMPGLKDPGFMKAQDEYLSQVKEKADQLRQAAREEAERASQAAERTINAARVEADTILSRAQNESDRLLRQAEEALKDAQARLDAAQSPRDADAGDSPKRRFGLFGRGKKA